MITYTLRQLEYFVATAEQSSVAGAAGVLNISQPSVSNAIIKLEEHFGVQLFVRHHAQGVSLTPLGRRILADAKSLLRHAGDLHQAARAAGDVTAGELELGCFITLAPLFMPALVTGFSKQHSGVRISLHEGIQDDLVEGLRSGRFEQALLYDLDLPETIARVPLSLFEPYVLLPEDHPLTRHSAVSLDALKDEPLILLDIPPSRDYFTGLFNKAGLEPTVAFSSASLEMVRGLVGQGLGYSLLVTRPHGDHTYDGCRIEARPLAHDAATSVICLAQLAQSRPTRLMDAFTVFCQAWFDRTFAREAHEPVGTMSRPGRRP